MAGRVVLSYKDVVVYEGDALLLAAPNWLNDVCIQLAWVLCDPPSEVLLMDPAVYSCMMLQCEDPEDAAELRDGLGLGERRLVLVPINDASDLSVSSRGSHWSLLAYFADRNAFEHYDSMPGSRHVGPAKRAALALATLLNLDTSSADPTRVPVPRQDNGYDCGAHVVAAARALVAAAPNSFHQPTAPLLETVTPAKAAAMRRYLANQVAVLSAA